MPIPNPTRPYSIPGFLIALVREPGVKLAGMRLVGFSLWRSPEGEIFVTFPSRALGVGSERRYFDYLRAVDGDAETVKRVKAWILDEYRKVQAAA